MSAKQCFCYIALQIYCVFEFQYISQGSILLLDFGTSGVSEGGIW